MPRQKGSATMEELLPGKIRKRVCSSSASSSSSIIQNYRFKRAILVGKRGGSSTPVPTWKLMGKRTPSSTLRALESSPKSLNGKAKQQQAPVSARKLAATLWEMNEMPSPQMKEEIVEERRLRKEGRGRERRPVHSGSLPPHLSDPSHSPVSERIDRSGTGSCHRRTSSISQKLRLMDQSIGAFDSVSNASLMEIETRSQAQTPSGSTVGVKPRLKDVSNALTTSKELLKIINRVWGNEDRPSSSLSLISALHAELERARLQVNHFIQEQCSDQNEINYLLKCFAEEKAAWKNKEQKVVEAAIESIAGELDVEKKLRRRFESLNKKLGKELAETKASLLKAVKELESEKRARVVMQKVCDELARDIGDDKAEVEELKRESAKLCEEVEKEREMMQLADVLREERVHMKLSEAKYQLEEKNAAVDKLQNQLEAFLGTKRTKEKGRSSSNYMNDEEIAAYLSKNRFVSHQSEINEEDGEVDDGVICEEGSAESDLHSIELNMDNNNKSYKWTTYPSGTPRDVRKAAIDEEDIKGRKSTSSKLPRRSTSLQRSISDGVEWDTRNERVPFAGDGIDWGRFSGLERQGQGKVYGDEMHGHQSVKGLRDYLLSGSRLDSPRGYASPMRQAGQLRSSLDPSNLAQERPPVIPGNVSKSRLSEAKAEGMNLRKSKW
ncbi:hypothetical protein POPTR_006G207800v4 [Populus trichocarpa]|uniref:Uncharacterized protein n=1 Tax=Populus trichocarpa TaxID=3694 RepID=A0A2K2A5I3_POPTR|nr:uncharacterized protein At5g41620 [Populus trichocarpa]PNT32778.1 hypothetical protein POPTR_006G207800v4 [Populus trichocarpa]|eukprot:XP_002309409.2 uncharacterized protein At5g41620 [Populus trichocarpa]